MTKRQGFVPRVPRYLNGERWCDHGQHYVKAPIDVRLYCHGKLVRSGPRRLAKDKEKLREAFPEVFFPSLKQDSLFSMKTSILIIQNNYLFSTQEVSTQEIKSEGSNTVLTVHWPSKR